MTNPLIQLRRHWRSLILPGVIVLYVLFLVGYGLLWLVKRDALWQIDLLSNFTAWYFLPAPLLMIIAVLLKRYRWALPLLIIVLIGAVNYVPRFLPHQTSASAADTSTLTVMTMNMLKRNTRWDAVQGQIQTANPDVVSIQEIPDAFLTDEWSKLAISYPYNTHAFSPEETSNMGLLSRYPIVEESAFKLPEQYDLTQIRAVININGQSVVVYNLHLAAPEFSRRSGPSGLVGRIFPYQYSAFYRRWQMGAFYDRLAKETLPVLVMGDFNTADSSGDYERFKTSSGLQDTYAEVGSGMGFSFPIELLVSGQPVPFVPLMRLDYVWHSTRWQPLSAWLGGTTGSDHLPLIARLRLAG